MGEIKWKLCELEAEKVRALEVEERKIADLETALAESKEKVDILRVIFLFSIYLGRTWLILCGHLYIII